MVLDAQTVSQMVDHVLAMPLETRLMLLAPVVDGRKGEHVEVLEELRAQGYVRARINGTVVELDQAPKLDLRKKHTIEVVIDRFKVRPEMQQRLAESFETALRLSDGLWCFPPSLRVRNVVTASPNLSRACFRSTTRPERARPAMAWASNNFSIRRGWWRIPS